VPIIAIAPQKFRDCLGPERDFLGVAATLGAARCPYKPFMPRDLITAVITCVGRRSKLPASEALSEGQDAKTHPQPTRP
jgi:hypothetical protein